MWHKADLSGPCAVCLPSGRSGHAAWCNSDRRGRGLPIADIEGMKIPQCSGLRPHRVCYCLVAAHEGSATPPPRFRTIQVSPKDLPAHLWQAERAVNRPTATRGGWRTPHVLHEAARVHHAGRRRGSVAARGARAAADDTGDRISQRHSYVEPRSRTGVGLDAVIHRNKSDQDFRREP